MHFVTLYLQVMYRAVACAIVLSAAAASAGDFRPFWSSTTCDRSSATGLALKQSRTVKSDVVVSAAGQRAWSEVAVVGFAEGDARTRRDCSLTGGRYTGWNRTGRT